MYERIWSMHRKNAASELWQFSMESGSASIAVWKEHNPSGEFTRDPWYTVHDLPPFLGLFHLISYSILMRTWHCDKVCWLHFDTAKNTFAVYCKHAKHYSLILTVNRISWHWTIFIHSSSEFLWEQNVKFHIYLFDVLLCFISLELFSSMWMLISPTLIIKYEQDKRHLLQFILLR